MNQKPLEKVSVIPPDEPPPPSVTPLDMLNRAVLAGADIAMIEKLMLLHERWDANQARKAFDEAVAAAKRDIPPIQRNVAGHNARKYADFAAIAKVVDPIIGAHGLSYRFRTTQNERISVTCILSHKAGHSEETTLSGPADTSGSKNAIQAIGSTLTYLQRYSLVQMLGLAAGNDDDGKAAGDGEKITAEQAQEIADKCAAVADGFDESFCNYFDIDEISDLPAKEYQRAIIAIGKKKGNGCKMSEIIQGTDEWKALRLGKVTASRVADVVARTKSGYGASRANYAAQLIAERLTGVPAESYVNAAMQHGTDTEPEARSAYEFYQGVTVEQVAFVPHPAIAEAGCSPDGLVGDDGMVEIKCPQTAGHLETLLGQAVPGKYEKQMQFQMACCGRKWVDFVSYDPRMPEHMRLFVMRVDRDDKQIAELETEITAFLLEMSAKLAQLDSLYGEKAAA